MLRALRGSLLSRKRFPSLTLKLSCYYHNTHYLNSCFRVFTVKDNMLQTPLALREKQTIIQTFEHRVEVKPYRWPHFLNFSYVWLRDHCRCQMCYNKDTFQRIKDVYEIPLNIKPLSLTCDENSLNIVWPDDHSSRYDFKFLWENCFEGKSHSSKFVSPTTWNALSFPSHDLITIPLNQFIESREGQAKLVEALLKYGVAFVSEVPATVENTRATVEALCMIKRTFFGELWSFTHDLEHADTAYSNEYLGPHTDTTYFTEASRIQVFHCLKASKEGGETLLVDGFHVAEQLRQKDLKSYDFLTNHAVPAEYIGDGQHHMSCDTVFKHHPLSKRLKQFRYNIYDRAPLTTLPFEKVNKYYQSLLSLTSFVRHPANQIEFLLSPGRVMFIDNWRVMHGRNAYRGERIMGGCYLDNTDFTSKARTLGFIIE